MIARVTFLIALLLFAAGTLAADGDDCEHALTSRSIEGALSELPPLALDIPTVREGVRKLLRDLVPLHRDFDSLKSLETDLVSGRLSPQLAQRALDRHYERVSRHALDKLNEWNGESAGRELLEGYKILLKRLRASKSLAKNLAERAARRPEEEDSEEPRPLAPDTQESLKEMAREELAKSARRELEDENSQNTDRAEKQLQDMNREKFDELLKKAADNFERKQQQDQGQESNPQQQKLEDRIRERIKQATEERRQAQEQKRAQKQQQAQSQQQQEAQPSQEEKSQDQKAPQEQRSSERPESSQSRKQSSEQQESRDRENSPESHESQKQNQKDRNPSEKTNSEKEPSPEDEVLEKMQREAKAEAKAAREAAQQQAQSEGEPQDGQQSQGDHGQSDQPQQGEDHSADGQKGGGAQDQSGKSERRKGADKYDKATEQEGDSKEFNQEGSDGQIEGGVTGDKSIGRDLAKFLEKLNFDKMSKEIVERRKNEPSRKKNTPIWPKAGKNNDSKTRNDQSRRENRNINIDQNKTTELIGALLKVIWPRILESYDQSESFFSAINQYATIANKYGAQLHVDSLRLEAERALKFYQSLRSQGVSYRNFEDLANSLMGDLSDADGALIRRIRFIHELLQEKHRQHILSDKEETLFNLITRIFESLAPGQANDEQIAASFLKKLMGPLSLNTVQAKYGDSSGRLDIHTLARDIRNGALTDLILYPRLEPYMNILLNEQEVPSVNHRFDGPEVPVNNADFDLIQADELDEMPHFYRDGTPLGLDLMRLLSGDMLRMRYQDEVERFDPKKPKPKKVSIVLVDMSGSMGSNQKYVLRNALMNAYLDKSQRDVVRDGGEHVVIFIPFDARPQPAQRQGSIEQAQAYFDNLRNHPLKAGGDDSITGAVMEAYNMIHNEEQEGGGELERANILLLTDAVAPVDFGQITAAREKLSEKTKVKLNALTMGDYNKDVTQLVELAADGAIGEVSHQHIPYPEIQMLMNNYSVELIEDAKYEGKNPRLKSADYAELSRKANAVALQFSQRRMDAAGHLREIRIRLKQAMERQAQPKQDKLAQVFRELINQQLSGGWSPAERAEMIAVTAEAFARRLAGSNEEPLDYLDEKTLRALLIWIGED
jgi:uncharacterized protein YegL